MSLTLTLLKLEYAPAVYSDEPAEEVDLIPMGCARLRISCFPVVSEDPGANRWQKVPEHVPIEERKTEVPFDENFDMNAAAVIG